MQYKIYGVPIVWRLNYFDFGSNSTLYAHEWLKLITKLCTWMLWIRDDGHVTIQSSGQRKMPHKKRKSVRKRFAYSKWLNNKIATKKNLPVFQDYVKERKKHIHEAKTGNLLWDTSIFGLWAKNSVQLLISTIQASIFICIQFSSLVKRLGQKLAVEVHTISIPIKFNN